MHNSFFMATLTLLAGLSVVPAASAKDTRCFEMRVYYAPEGKLDDLNARFRDHTMALFEKHGMQNIGYFMPVDNKDNKLVYFLAYPSREAREKSWKAFFVDPDWQKAYKASEANGKLVSKVESYFLQATDYSPEIKPAKGSEPRLFELRTYWAAEGKLDALNARFRDHTVRLFGKHGMENLAYWSRMSDQPEADKLLVYLLAHKSKEARDASFKNFGADPDWVAARKASEEKAGGGLTAKDGVKSELWKATDYSPMK